MADENNAAAEATAAAAHSKLSCWFCCYMLRMLHKTYMQKIASNRQCIRSICSLAIGLDAAGSASVHYYKPENMQPVSLLLGCMDSLTGL
jgi:hypothetical protein